jgi:HSP20 family molecular chaperone IbpA
MVSATRLASGTCRTHISPQGCRFRGLLHSRFDKDVSMTKPTLGTHPFLLGFEQLERLVEHTAKTGNDGYPPYNIEQTSGTSYRISLAVAGFCEADLSITVENRQLVVRGRQADEDDGRVFLHRGIARRQFQRSFVLADGVKVRGASMASGLLHIDLQRSEPETVLQRIEITSGGQS